MVTQEKINNEEFVPQERMTLSGVKYMSFETKNEATGQTDKIEGCMLSWLFYPSNEPNTVGRETSREFRANTNLNDWKINADYEPNISIKIVKGKPVAKIDGYKLCK